MQDVTHNLEQTPASADIAELAGAFVLAQSEFEPVEKDSKGQVGPRMYKYASLKAVLAQVRDPLAKHRLAVLQLLVPTAGDRVHIRSMLLHSSGQHITSDLILSPTKTDPQSIGSAITYARRYSLQALLGLTVDDDDAQAHQPADGRKMETVHLSGARPAPRREEGFVEPGMHRGSPPPRVVSSPEPADVLSAGQLRAIHAAGIDLYSGGNGEGDTWEAKRPEIVAAVTKGRTRSSSELTPGEASSLLDSIAKQKAKTAAVLTLATSVAEIADAQKRALDLGAIDKTMAVLDPEAMDAEQRPRFLADLNKAMDDATPF